MVKRCQWGLCNSDSRYPERLEGGIKFIPFPKPRRSREKCLRWIRLCGRPHDQLNVNIVDGNRHLFVCTKHFVEGAPTDRYPDPLPALPNNAASATVTPVRKPPTRRALSEPAKKRRKVLANITCVENEVVEQQTLQMDENTQPSVPSILTDSATKPDEEILKGISPLDMLALTAENQQLKETVAKLILENDRLRTSCVNENSDTKTASSSSSIEDTITKRSAPFSVEEAKNSHVKNNFKYLTGFVYERFMTVFSFLMGNEKELPFKYTKAATSLRKMPAQDQLLLTLMKLRQNFDYKLLAHLFMISPQDVSLIFTNWINYMFFQFGSVPIWPHRDIIIQHMPSKFKLEFPNTVIILDGTEIKTKRPSALNTQSQCYSDYKSSPTLKGLIGVDPCGSVTFISMLFAGSISDKEISSQSGLLKTMKDMLSCGMIKEGDGVMVDKGFNIKTEIENLGLELIIPPNAPSEGQMSASDVAKTKKIAVHRVRVENTIGRIKDFKILSHRLDLSLFANINQIWFVCCFLTNFMPYLIHD